MLLFEYILHIVILILVLKLDLLQYDKTGFRTSSINPIYSLLSVIQWIFSIFYKISENHIMAKKIRKQYDYRHDMKIHTPNITYQELSHKLRATFFAITLISDKCQKKRYF